MKILSALFILLSLLCVVLCDLPTNCSYDDTVGSWMFHLGKTGNDNTLDCTTFDIQQILEIELTFPNHAVDQYGNVGTWSMIYNQGFEVIVNGRRYFAFQYYKGDANSSQSFCHQLFNGWSHDLIQDNVYPPKNWGCYSGVKLYEKKRVKLNRGHVDHHALRNYVHNEDFIDEINSKQTSWKAGFYEQYTNFTLHEMQKRAGGYKRLPRVKTSSPSPEIIERVSELPAAFDWRSVRGVDFVSPIRNQGSCGSCYAFGSMAMLEARARVMTSDLWQPVFSTQDVVSCSQYSQGCEGGFPYLVAGMYAQDFGVISEEDYPYVGRDTSCMEPKNASRTFVGDYGYVGRFYGGCNEELMRVNLVEQGPLAVSIEVYPDLQAYKGGIYHHTDAVDNFNPFEITNHIVLIVGYGIDHDSGEKYWIVKNSWGTSWGEQGYFRIRRGTDEIAIESIAVYANLYLGV